MVYALLLWLSPIPPYLLTTGMRCSTGLHEPDQTIHQGGPWNDSSKTSSRQEYEHRQHVSWKLARQVGPVPQHNMSQT